MTYTYSCLSTMLIQFFWLMLQYNDFISSLSKYSVKVRFNVI
jgi:hypothetical protein